MKRLLLVIVGAAILLLPMPAYAVAKLPTKH